MSTINGIGSRFFGCAEPHKDGSYIATKWLCLVAPLVPLGSYRLWPESHSSYALGMYSSSTFRSKSAGLYFPQVFKMYGIYLAIYLFLVLVDRFGSGEWHFN